MDSNNNPILTNTNLENISNYANENKSQFIAENT